jgi:hypothetical protein
MKVVIILVGHTDKYLGVWELEIDGKHQLTTASEKEIEKRLSCLTGVTSISFCTRNIQPKLTWFDRLKCWIASTKKQYKYKYEDRTAQTLEIKCQLK